MRIVSERDGDLQRAARAGQGRDRRDRRGRGARAPGRGAVRRRPRARGVGGGRRSRRVHVPRGQLESRIEGLVPDRSTRDRPLLLRRLALRVRREGAQRARLRERHVAHRRLHRLEAERLRGRDAALADAGPAAPLLPPPADPRGRRGGPGAAARVARPPDRRRRARLARVALPRRRRRRHARDRRRGRRRRLEPAAPDRPLDRHARRAEGALGEADDRGAQPGRRRQDLRGAPDLRERRADPRRGLGRDRRRRRQLPHALPRQRRVGLARDPGRPRLDLPLRGPGHGLQPAAKARATAASSPRRRRRSSLRAAPRAACSASCPGSSGRSRRTRR